MWFPNTALLKLHHLTEKLWLYGSSSNMLPSGGGSARTTSAAALRLRQRLQEQSIQQHLLDGGEDQDGDDIVQLPSGEAEDDEEEDDEDDDEERFKPLDIKGTSIRKVYSSSIKHWNAFALIQKYHRTTSPAEFLKMVPWRIRMTLLSGRKWRNLPTTFSTRRRRRVGKIVGRI
mmetsp:Transcript_17380/g.26160  ORF Transcript_17380/g.26160 Transcript_17380/m.26160 type:complete len:174 (+) Transcript_17380:140-661(+)